MTYIAVRSSEPDDIKVLNDLIRAYFPHPELKHLPEQEEFFAAFDLCLDIRRQGAEGGYQITLSMGGKEYCHAAAPTKGGFREEKLNREKRLLRLAVHNTLVQYFGSTGQTGKISPWGVLTGVRPTKIVHRLRRQGMDNPRIISHLVRDFGLNQAKAALLTEVAVNQEPFLPKGEDLREELSVYLGIPFCPSRCHYCSFPSYGLDRWSKQVDTYLQGLLAELQICGAYLRGKEFRVRNIYLGGGTPTTLTASQLELLLSRITEELPAVSDRELTVEAGRPDTIDREKLQVMKGFNVTRLSINPQSMHDETLAAVGRMHTVQESVDIYHLAREVGFPVINMDLIIGLPGENIDLVQESVRAVLALQSENITLHALALKRAARYKQEGLELKKDGVGQLMMDYVQESLQKAGYEPYYLYRQKDILAHGENVGYSRPGKYCKYNILMMEEAQTILGLGVGAGSKFIDPVTYGVDNHYNPRDLFVYLERLEENARRKVDKLKSIV